MDEEESLDLETGKICGHEKYNKMQEIISGLTTVFAHRGFEIYSFKIGWYNEQVDKHFHFDLHPDTLAFIVISTPQMFERTLIPFICQDELNGSMDLLDKCMKHFFSLAQTAFPDEDVEVIHDFELTHSRRPRVLVQPAGHVAGAAYYYTRRCLNPDPFGGKKIYGVSIHPKYGGWFALRGVIVFKSVQCPNLPRIEPVDCVSEQEQRVSLLELFNFHWQDWRFRDIIEVTEKYSENQKQYFKLLPKDRKPLVQQLRQQFLQKNGDNTSGEVRGERVDKL